MIARMNDESFEGGESVEREVEVFGEGRRLFAEDETAERFVFKSEDFDANTPLFYFDARWHDPNPGQFLSTDPVGYEEDKLNVYRHVAANPTNHVDPTGL